jgi:hypothetical protein
MCLAYFRAGYSPVSCFIWALISDGCTDSFCQGQKSTAVFTALSLAFLF